MENQLWFSVKHSSIYHVNWWTMIRVSRLLRWQNMRSQISYISVIQSVESIRFLLTIYLCLMILEEWKRPRFDRNFTFDLGTSDSESAFTLNEYQTVCSQLWRNANAKLKENLQCASCPLIQYAGNTLPATYCNIDSETCKWTVRIDGFVLVIEYSMQRTAHTV